MNKHINNALMSGAILVSTCLTGCTDNAKVDALTEKIKTLSNALQMQDERNTASTPRTHSIVDIERKQEVAVIATERPFAVGDLIFINDDIYKVEANKLWTQVLTHELANKNIKNLYYISGSEVLVSFQGKASKAPAPRESATPSSP